MPAGRSSSRCRVQAIDNLLRARYSRYYDWQKISAGTLMRYAGRLWVGLTLTQCSGQKTSGVSKNSAAMVRERCSTGMTRASVNITRDCQTRDVRLSFIRCAWRVTGSCSPHVEQE